MSLFRRKRKPQSAVPEAPKEAPRRTATEAKEVRADRFSARPPRPGLIGEMLVEAGYVERKHLEAALALHRASGRKLVACLCDLGLMSQKSFEQFLARQPGLASIDLKNYPVKKEILELIPQKFALAHQIVPIDRMGNSLTVGMVCPLDKKTLAELQEMTQLRVSPMLCSLSEIKSCIEKYYSGK